MNLANLDQLSLFVDVQNRLILICNASAFDL